MMASSASARIDGRLWPPERDSPSPSRRICGSPSPSASWCRVSCLTRLARTRDRSPSGRSPSFSYSMAATARLSTASPRNSRRSWCSAEKLRWVRACSSRPGRAKRCCSFGCRCARTGASPFTRAAGSFAGVGVLEQEERRTEHVDFLVVGKGHHVAVAFLGDHQVLRGDGLEVVDIRGTAEGSPDLGGRAVVLGAVHGL